MLKLSDITNGVDKSVFANSINKELKDNISSQPIIIDNGYSIEKHKNSSFIKLDNSKGSIRTTNYKQWIWLLDTLKSNNSKNVFILMPQPLSFGDNLEEKLFLDTLGELKDKGIDVWVLTGGSTNKLEVTVKEGIRFVNLKAYPTEQDIDIFNDLQYIEFTANDGYVTYEIKNMY